MALLRFTLLGCILMFTAQHIFGSNENTLEADSSISASASDDTTVSSILALVGFPKETEIEDVNVLERRKALIAQRPKGGAGVWRGKDEQKKPRGGMKIWRGRDDVASSDTSSPKGISRWRGRDSKTESDEKSPKGISRWRGRDNYLPSVMSRPKGLSRWRGRDTDILLDAKRPKGISRWRGRDVQSADEGSSLESKDRQINRDSEKAFDEKRPKGLSRWRGRDTSMEVEDEGPKGISRWRGRDALVGLNDDTPKGISRWRGKDYISTISGSTDNLNPELSITDLKRDPECNGGNCRRSTIYEFRALNRRPKGGFGIWRGREVQAKDGIHEIDNDEAASWESFLQLSLAPSSESQSSEIIQELPVWRGR